jgi:hypothetical protein
MIHAVGLPVHYLLAYQKNTQTALAKEHLGRVLELKPNYSDADNVLRLRSGDNSVSVQTGACPVSAREPPLVIFTQSRPCVRVDQCPSVDKPKASHYSSHTFPGPPQHVF